MASVGLLANGWYVSKPGANSQLHEQSELSMYERTPIADACDGTTAITTQSNNASGAEGGLMTLGADGCLMKYDRR